MKNVLGMRLFERAFPEYASTKVLDRLRRKEYRRLDKNRHVYLDYTGAHLYSESQVTVHLRQLKEHVFGNPHSVNPTSLHSTEKVEATRQAVLDYFHAGDEYYCVFTANASAALKIVGESYPFDEKSALLLSLDNHNSVNGIREYAKAKGATFRYTPLIEDTLHLDPRALFENLEAFPDCKDKLFAFPAQSNVSGVQHPLEYVRIAQEGGWHVLLDTAAFVPSNPLDLQKVSPEFAVVSFYKMFGYPTGIGCLLMKKGMLDRMVKPWYAGGTISLSAATYDGHYLLPNHERFEDGTVNYLDLPAVAIGLEHLQKIGMDVISRRVKILTAWVLQEMGRLTHANGRPVVKVFGDQRIQNRGGTIVFNVLDAGGSEISFRVVEEAAHARRISLRTGCFCNPGLDETNNKVTFDHLKGYFAERKHGDFFDMIRHMGKLRGSNRISIGFVTNYRDVEAFVEFLRSFATETVSTRQTPVVRAG